MSKELVIVALCLISIFAIYSFSDQQKRQERLAPYQKLVFKANRPRIIDFGATWCPACQAMQTDWADARQRYSDRVDFVSIDWDKGDPYHLIFAYGIRSLPTIVFLNSKGIEVNRQVGWPPPQGLPPMIESVLRHSLTRSRLSNQSLAQHDSKIVASFGR
jgi:thioredoxin 1